MEQKMSAAVIDLPLARRVLEIVDAGLVHGLGRQEPGKMCVEAAVCAALGLPHGDSPPCVHPVVRTYKIRLNDSLWSTNEARALGMRRLAVAQLGSDGIDGRKWLDLVRLATVRQILPVALRAATSIHPEKKHRTVLEAAAVKCEGPTSADANAAYAAADDADAARDRVLTLAADIALAALRECNSPGVALLDQIEAWS